MTNWLAFRSRVSAIEGRYNPERDLPQAPCPDVSWAEYDLLLMILSLENRISELEEAVQDYNRRDLMED